MKHSEKIKRLEELMDEPLVCEFHDLAAEIDAYEREHFPTPPATLAEVLLFMRQQMKETQREMSARAGIALERWKKLETGSDPSMKDARKLFEIGVPPKAILQDNAIGMACGDTRENKQEASPASPSPNC